MADLRNECASSGGVPTHLRSPQGLAKRGSAWGLWPAATSSAALSHSRLRSSLRAGDGASAAELDSCF